MRAEINEIIYPKEQDTEIGESGLILVYKRRRTILTSMLRRKLSLEYEEI